MPRVLCVSLVVALTAPAPTTLPNAGFGQSLAIGDFDGDGVTDLLVGAPPYDVYLYKGPVVSGAAPTATIPAPLGSGTFGASLAVGNVDGKPGVEALIGDPGATVDGQTDAGNVNIYTGPKLATMVSPTPVLTDRSGGAGEAYGTAVGALPFCAAGPCGAPTYLPLVGEPKRAFVYFTLGPLDPRKM